MMTLALTTLHHRVVEGLLILRGDYTDLYQRVAINAAVAAADAGTPSALGLERLSGSAN